MTSLYCHPRALAQRIALAGAISLLAACGDSAVQPVDIETYAASLESVTPMLKSVGVAAAIPGTELIVNGSFGSGTSNWTQTSKRPYYYEKTGIDLGDVIGAPLGAAGPAPSGTAVVARFCGTPYTVNLTDPDGTQRFESANCLDKLIQDGVVIPATATQGTKLSGWTYGNYGCTAGVSIQVIFMPTNGGPRIPAAKLTPVDLPAGQWQRQEITLPASAAGFTYKLVILAQSGLNGAVCKDNPPQTLSDTWFLVTDISMKPI
jgi:hypothetical protein